MATTKTVTALMTAEEFAALPEDEQSGYELMRGRLVPVGQPSFGHGDVALWLGAALTRYVRAHRLGRVAGGDPFFIFERDPDTVRGPDIAFVRTERLPADLDRFLELVPDLAVEVRSPSDRRGKVEAKARWYIEQGVPLVWLADPRRSSVTVFRPGRPPVTLGSGDVLDGEDVVPGFQMPVAEIFS
jgi:Uma2 family endonuclease